MSEQSATATEDPRTSSTFEAPPETSQNGVQTIEFPEPTPEPAEESKRPGGPRPLEETARIHACLEKHGGGRIAAAAELGLSIQDLKNRIYESPVLRLRWAVNDDGLPPDEIAAMLNSEPVTTQQERLAEVIQMEDAKLRRGLANIGLSAKSVEMGLALQALSRDSFASNLGIVSGGMTKTVIDSLTFFAETSQRISSVRRAIEAMGDVQNETRVLWVEEEARLSEILISAGDLMRKMMMASVESNRVLAIVKHKLNGGGQRKVKPSFTDIGT